LDVLVNGASLFASAVGDPFGTSNECKSPNLTSVTITCSTNGSDEATFGIPWTVPAPGTHTITVSIKHQNDIGEDEETVTFSLIAVEYPAPPAIANAYINRTFPKSAAKVRGCVISQIAEKHAHDSAYGPKGGPYDSALVEADVLSFWAPCGGQ
jgi:hypothetical protein